MKTNLRSAFVKSKRRIRDLGEVFTAEREVNAMLSLLPESVWSYIETTFLEPACGDGNFLEKILRRKLNLVPKKITKTNPQHKIEYTLLRVAASMYGVDICPENVNDCRARLMQEIKDFWSNTYDTAKMSSSFLTRLEEILKRNIIAGNTLVPEKVEITEWYRPSEGTLKPRVYTLADMQNPSPKPIREEKLITYYKDKE